MFDRLVRFAVEQKLLMVLAAIVLLCAGGVAWRHLPIDAFPDVTNTQVMVLTEAPGLAPAEVERLVTAPIEGAMGGLPMVQQVRSVSKSGLSQVIVIFEDAADTYFTRQVVFERLVQAREKLPAGIEPEMGPISTGLGEIYQYALESGFFCQQHPAVWAPAEGPCTECGAVLQASDHDLTSLRTLQDWLVAPQLRRLPGVNEVNSFGGLVKQFHVLPRPEMLLKYGISLADVAEALEQNNANASGGAIVHGWEQMNVVSKGLIRDPDDMERIVLKAVDGAPIYLRDVAEVRVGHQTRTGAVTKDGSGEAVIGMAIMLKGANSKAVVDRVKATIPEIQRTLPPGVRIVPFYDRTDLIQACVRTVSSALLQGIVLIVLVLFLVLWDLRAALIVALLLPLTTAVTFLLMGWQGVSANLMSLGGLAIAIGMVVDAAIVIVENTSRHLRERAASSLARSEIVFAAVREVVRPVAFAALIIIIVFLPLFALESMEGRMFKPLALTMIFAMVGSLAVSLTIIPALGALLIRRRAETGGGNLLVRTLLALYMPLLRLCLRRRWVTVTVALAAMAGALALLPRIGTEFLPALDEGALAINLVRLPTASVEGSVAQCTELEKRLLARFPEVTTVVSKTGRAEISEDPMGPEQSDLLIMLKPKSQWRPGLSRDRLVREVGVELAAIPGLRPAFSQPIALRVNELISGIKADVALKVFGEDLERLGAIGEAVAPLLAAVPGAEDVKIEQVSGLTQLEIQHDREAMARHGINAADINDLIETAVGGRVATTVFEGQRQVAVLVRFPESLRGDTAQLGSLLVPSPGGYSVPLADLAALREVEVPAQISREDSMRRLTIECNVRDRDIGSFVAEAKASLAPIEAGLPTGYRLAWGGQFENQQRAAAKLRVVVPVALLLIFVLLFSSLGSLKSALLVLANLPFALVGGVLAIYLLGISLSVSAAIGFIVLLGVAVENGLVLVSFLDQLRREGRSVQQAIAEACGLRLRPLLMTTLTTLLGLTPLLYATGAGSEIQRPLVAVIFGGLVSSLALTLIVLPVLYSLVNREPTLAPTEG
jgi:cobalt-zinc-cadmium resistance protein CzcA